MSIKKVCDICGKDMSPNPIASAFEVKIKRKGLLEERLDICRECMDKFKTWVKSEVEK